MGKDFVKVNCVLGIVILGLTASCCGGGEVGIRTVVTTFYPMYIAALNVTAGVDGVRVVNLAAPSTGCLHDYQLTPRDWAVLSKADVILAHGAGMDSFLGDVSARWPKTKVVDLSARLDLLVDSGITNAHVWVSPRRHSMQVQAMAEGLSGWGCPGS